MPWFSDTIIKFNKPDISSVNKVITDSRYIQLLNKIQPLITARDANLYTIANIDLRTMSFRYYTVPVNLVSEHTKLGYSCAYSYNSQGEFTPLLLECIYPLIEKPDILEQVVAVSVERIHKPGYVDVSGMHCLVTYYRHITVLENGQRRYYGTKD